MHCWQDKIDMDQKINIIFCAQDISDPFPGCRSPTQPGWLWCDKPWKVEDDQIREVAAAGAGLLPVGGVGPIVDRP
jgi:hypothetical protein